MSLKVQPYLILSLIRLLGHLHFTGLWLKHRVTFTESVWPFLLWLQKSCPLKLCDQEETLRGEVLLSSSSHLHQFVKRLTMSPLGLHSQNPEMSQGISLQADHTRNIEQASVSHGLLLMFLQGKKQLNSVEDMLSHGTIFSSFESLLVFGPWLVTVSENTFV